MRSRPRLNGKKTHFCWSWKVETMTFSALNSGARIFVYSESFVSKKPRINAAWLNKNSQPADIHAWVREGMKFYDVLVFSSARCLQRHFRIKHRMWFAPFQGSETQDAFEYSDVIRYNSNYQNTFCWHKHGTYLHHSGLHALHSHGWRLAQPSASWLEDNEQHTTSVHSSL